MKPTQAQAAITLSTSLINQKMEKITASFLFADVKGYSKLTEPEVKCFYQEILPDLKTKLEASKYYENIKDINTWGDGLMVYTSDPYSLAHLALEIRDFYSNYNWKNKRMPQLVVRISLHHGVIYKGRDPFRERDSIIGTEVTLGARLEPATEPGQVWVTEQFKQLIRKENDPTLQFDDLGKKELAKDHGEIQVYRLRRPHNQIPSTPSLPKPFSPESLLEDKVRKILEKLDDQLYS